MNRMKYKAKFITDVNSLIGDYQMVTISQGKRGEICILAVDQVPKREDEMFVQSKTSITYNYKVFIIAGDYINEMMIPNQTWNYNFVQLIDNENILLACARSRYYKEGIFDKNAKVFNFKGKLKREFLLGDGIQDLKVTSKNNIWTSYFDEGVFGNYGWNNPVGAEGLRAWNHYGKEIYVYNNNGEHYICDCYALNVVSDDEIWFYYYTEFELACKKYGKIKYYKTDVKGSDGFIVYCKYVLFRGGYAKNDQYFLYEIKETGLHLLDEVILVDDYNQALECSYVDCRGSKMILLSGNKVYSIALNSLLIEKWRTGVLELS